MLVSGTYVFHRTIPILEFPAVAAQVLSVVTAAGAVVSADGPGRTPVYAPLQLIVDVPEGD
jgi:hypothetical protein